MKNTKHYINHGITWLTVMVLYTLPQIVMAALPTPPAPSRGAVAAGDYIGGAKEYAFDIFDLFGLLAAAIALFYVVWNVIGKYREAGDSNSRVSLPEVGVQAGVGVIVVVFVIFLIKEAGTVL